jgi:hypothetical protein
MADNKPFVAPLLQSYADESWGPGSPYLTVAGYLMNNDQYVALDRAWAAGLGSLPYFHMREGHHLQHPSVYANLLNCITPQSVVAGFSASVDKAHFEAIARAKFGGQSLKYWFGGPYSFCILQYMNRVGGWVNQNVPESRVAYTFEAGHSRHGEADMFLGLYNAGSRYAEHRENHRYASYTFLNGKETTGRALQAADMLSWHINTHDRDRSVSAELRHLWQVPTHYMIFDRDGVEQAVFEHLKWYEQEKRNRAAARRKRSAS